MKSTQIAGMLGREPVDQQGHFLDHGLIDLARYGFAAVALGKRDHADRERGPTDNVRPWRTASSRMRAIEAHQFRGSAADIKQDDAVCFWIEQLGAAGRRESRLGRGIDDFKLKSGFFGNARAKLLAV